MSDDLTDSFPSQHKFLVAAQKRSLELFETDAQAIAAAHLPPDSVACGEGYAIDGSKMRAFKMPVSAGGLGILILQDAPYDPGFIYLWKSSTDLARPTQEEAEALRDDLQENDEDNFYRVYVQFVEIADSIAAWAARLKIDQAITSSRYFPNGFSSCHDNWLANFTLSTVPIERWRYERSKLKPEDVMIDLLVPGAGDWWVDLFRQDELYSIQWQPNEDLSIESRQIKYRRMKWPPLESLEDFPAWVAKVESVLAVKLLRHVNVSRRATGERSNDLDYWLKLGEAPLRQWLAPCADTLGTDFHSEDWTDPEPGAVQSQLASALACVDYVTEHYPSLVIDHAQIESLRERSGKTLAELRASEDY
jgi:hypothetical protein